VARGARGRHRRAAGAEPQSRDVVVMAVSLSTADVVTGHQILAPWMEAVGILNRIVPDEGSLIAIIGPVTVLLPPELGDELQPLIGQKIGILRTDDLVRSYRIRRFK